MAGFVGTPVDIYYYLLSSDVKNNKYIYRLWTDTDDGPALNVYSSFNNDSIPVRTGYLFKGWSVYNSNDPNGDSPTILDTNAVIGDFTDNIETNRPKFYAVWEPDTTKVLLEKGAVDIILGKLK